MNPLVIALVLSSTFMHAGWNLLARGQGREGTFFLHMLIVVAIAGFLPTAISEALVRSIPPEAWACAIGSGFCCGVYFLFLARSYSSADFTIVYPVARALPVLMVGVGDVLRGRNPTPIGWLGMVLVVLGCVLVPLYSFRDFSIRYYWNRTNLWLLLTALGTVGYTIFDKIASEVVNQGPGTAARYEYIFLLFSLGAYAAGIRVFKIEEVQSKSVGWINPALAAVLTFGAYWLVLWAYQMSAHAGYIVAFRQFSIVIGVIVAFALFKERGHGVRLSGIFLITTGLVIIGLWGR